MLKICCVLLGEDYTLLKNNTPQSRKKVYMFATTLLIPVIIWSTLGLMITTGILGKDWPIGILAALVCGTVVFALERMILMGNGNIITISSRILLAVAIALLGAMFMDQLIFKSDIDQELGLMKKAMKDSIFEVESAPLHAEIMKQDGILIDSKNQWTGAQENMIREADATGGTFKKGIGPVTMLKAGVSNRLEKEYMAQQAKYVQLKQQSEDLRDKVNTRVDKEFDNTSLLLRFDALGRLVDRDSKLKRVYRLITAIFFMLEFMVVIAKFSFGKTAYERLLETQEFIAERRQKYIMTGTSPLTHPDRMDPEMASIRRKLLLSRPGIFN